MDLLRVTTVALVACSAAGADPSGAPRRDAVHPEGWKQLPALATSVGAAAKADGVTIDSVDAWGEPANGCYAVWLALHGGRSDAPALADQVLTGLARAGAPRDAAAATQPARSRAGARKPGELTISEVVKPAERSGVLAFSFASAPYRGRVRAELGNGRVVAVACFANEREPLACDATCARLLEAAP